MYPLILYAESDEEKGFVAATPCAQSEGRKVEDSTHSKTFQGKRKESRSSNGEEKAKDEIAEPSIPGEEEGEENLKVLGDGEEGKKDEVEEEEGGDGKKETKKDGEEESVKTKEINNTTTVKKRKSRGTRRGADESSESDRSTERRKVRRSKHSRSHTYSRSRSRSCSRSRSRSRRYKDRRRSRSRGSRRRSRDGSEGDREKGTIVCRHFMTGEDMHMNNVDCFLWGFPWVFP